MHAFLRNTARSTCVLAMVAAIIPTAAGTGAAAGTAPRFLAAMERVTANAITRSTPVTLNGKIYAQSVIQTSSGNGALNPGTIATMEYDLGRACDRLDVTMGFRDDSAATSPITYRILLDGTVVDEQTVSRGQALTRSVALNRALRLRLESQSTGGYLPAWGNPILLCDGSPIYPDMVDTPCFETNSPFEDVPRTSVAARGVSCVARFGIANGVSQTRFAPERTVTRGQMAAFLARLIVNTGGSLPSAPADAFADDEDSPFEQDINQLAAVGVVRGGGDGTYRPLDPVSRAAMTAFLNRTISYRTGRPLAESTIRFDDVEPNGTFVNDIAALASTGITNGTAGTSFQPAALVTRAQMAIFLGRVLVTLNRLGIRAQAT